MSRNGVVVKVPGKVNLQLAVGPLESDGYHEITTIFQAISIFDDVTVRYGNPNTGIDRKSTRLNSSHSQQSRMPSSA